MMHDGKNGRSVTASPMFARAIFGGAMFGRLGAALALVGMLVPMVPVAAADLKLGCERQRYDQAGAPLEPERFTVTYSGAEAGELVFKGGSWGEGVVLPAHWETKENVIGIRAFGTTRLLLPDPASIRQCYEAAAKANAEATADGEINEFLAMGCRKSAPASPQPVDATVRAEIALMDNDVLSYFTEIAPASSEGRDKTLLTEPSFPQPNCTIER